VDKNTRREGLFEIGKVTLLSRRGHVATLSSVEAGKNVLRGTDVVAGSPGQGRPGGFQVVGGGGHDDR
jgi:hypothetical protein